MNTVNASKHAFFNKPGHVQQNETVHAERGCSHLDTMRGHAAMMLIGKQHVAEFGCAVRASCLELVQVAVRALQPCGAMHDG